MADKHRKRCSALLIVREMQTETTIRKKEDYSEVSPHTSQNGYHFRFFKKKLHITNAEEGVERRDPSYCVGGDVNWFSH